jgi:sigma-B regulation protein RsbU (phosphoserine phosphatase)
VNGGDVIVMATDGVLEQKDASGAQFGLGRVEAVVRSMRNRPAREVLDGLFSAVAEHRGRQPIDDDATVVIIRVLDTETR